MPVVSVALLFIGLSADAEIQVVDPDGVGLAGVPVEFTQLDDNYQSRIETVRTDAGGWSKVRLPLVDRDSVWVSVDDPSLGIPTFRLKREPVQVDRPLKARVKATNVDVFTGELRGNAEIASVGVLCDRTESTTLVVLSKDTDGEVQAFRAGGETAGGTFAFPGVPTATANGYLVAVGSRTEAAYFDFVSSFEDVRAGKYVINVPPLVSRPITVTDGEGPFEGVTLKYGFEGGPDELSAGRIPLGTTSKDGTVDWSVFQRLSSDATVGYRLYAHGEGVVATSRVIKGASEGPITIMVERSNGARCRLVDESGDPVEGHLLVIGPPHAVDSTRGQFADRPPFEIDKDGRWEWRSSPNVTLTLKYLGPRAAFDFDLPQADGFTDIVVPNDTQQRARKSGATIPSFSDILRRLGDAAGETEP